MELESWLKQEFDDYVQTCKRCDKIVLAVGGRFRVSRVRRSMRAKACLFLRRALYAGMKIVRLASSHLRVFPIGLDNSRRVAANSRSGDAHLHPYCHATILRAQNPRCPACQTSFTTHPPREVGEKAVSRAEDDYIGGNRKRKRPRGTGESGGGADELESEDGEGEGTDGEEGEGEEETRGESSGSLEQVGNGPVSAH
jgi:hypothetical protein